MYSNEELISQAAEAAVQLAILRMMIQHNRDLKLGNLEGVAA